MQRGSSDSSNIVSDAKVEQILTTVLGFAFWMNVRDETTTFDEHFGPLTTAKILQFKTVYFLINLYLCTLLNVKI